MSSTQALFRRFESWRSLIPSLAGPSAPIEERVASIESYIAGQTRNQQEFERKWNNAVIAFNSGLIAGACKDITQIVVASANVTFNGAAADVTGATFSITPQYDLTALIVTCFDVQLTTLVAGAGVFVGNLVINGVTQAGPALYQDNAANVRRNTVSQVYVVTLTRGTAYTIKLQGQVLVAADTYTVRQTQTKLTMMATPIPPAHV